jgi:hypothetical protein
MEAMPTTTLKPDHQLIAADILAMPLAEFRERFKFEPVDALEKWWYATHRKRLTAIARTFLERGACGEVQLDDVVMR